MVIRGSLDPKYEFGTRVGRREGRLEGQGKRVLHYGSQCLNVRYTGTPNRQGGVQAPQTLIHLLLQPYVRKKEEEEEVEVMEVLTNLFPPKLDKPLTTVRYHPLVLFSDCIFRAV